MAWQLGRDEELRAPVKLMGDPAEVGDPCCVCGTLTTIYTRIDPRLTAPLAHAKKNEP